MEKELTLPISAGVKYDGMTIILRRLFDESGIDKEIYITVTMFSKFSDDRSEYKLLNEFFNK